jgi:hypothetical protein
MSSNLVSGFLNQLEVALDPQDHLGCHKVGLKLPLKYSRGFSVCFGLFFMHLGVLGLGGPNLIKVDIESCFKLASLRGPLTYL